MMDIQEIRDMHYRQLRSGASRYEAIEITKRAMVAKYQKDGKYTEQEIRAFVDDILRI